MLHNLNIIRKALKKAHTKMPYKNWNEILDAYFSVAQKIDKIENTEESNGQRVKTARVTKNTNN